MKAVIARFALRQAVKYFRDHPDAIPGKIDDAVFSLLARHLGV